MIFSSYPFLLAFLPGVLLLLLFAMRGGVSAASLLGALIAASLLFYGLWDWRYLPLLLGSVVANYVIGLQIARGPKKAWLALGISLNLGLLAWFKYRLFLAELLPGGLLPGILDTTAALVLPLGISFFTFQQIAWLVDLSRRQVAMPSFREYTFFVTFFPQLIAGPILHARELLPQMRSGWPRWHSANFACGLMLLCLGLGKKVLLADPLDAPLAALYHSAANGAAMGGEAVWLAGFGYGIQLYFDFSGYADMAMGLGLILGLRLPANFSSPYRSRSLIDFWRRWHMTLSAFLRDYLYIPLGGRRRHYVTLMTTMLLGGLWHGAGWQFVAWGALHGAGLCLVHGWRRRGATLPATLAMALTLTFVMLAWVPFRADSLSTAWSLYTSVQHAWQLDLHWQWPTKGSLLAGHHAELVTWTLLGLMIALCLPNSLAWRRWAETVLSQPHTLRRARAMIGLGAVCGVLLFAVLKSLYGQPEQAFLYFEF